MKKALLVAMTLSLLAVTQNSMAGTKGGDVELGLNAQLRHISYSDDDSDSDINMLMLGIKAGYFFTDNISLGLSFMGVSMSSDDDDTGALFFEVEPNYHFMTDSTLVPYVGMHAGLIYATSGDDSETVPSYGAQAGIKNFFSENVALDVQLRWTHYSLEFGDDDEASIDDYGIIVGLNWYF